MEHYHVRIMIITTLIKLCSDIQWLAWKIRLKNEIKDTKRKFFFIIIALINRIFMAVAKTHSINQR